MLVLTRKQGENIAIGYDVVVTVVHTSRGRVQIGIDAPSWVRIDRRGGKVSGPTAGKKLPPKG